MAQALYAENDVELISKLRNLFIRARDARRARHDTWIRNYRLVNNRLGTTGMSNWMPSPRDSEIYPTLSSLVAWMMDNNTIVDAIPSADPHTDYYDFISKLSNDLASVIYTNWLVEDYNSQIKLSLWDAFIYGVGIIKNIWDGELSGGYGNAMMKRVDPWKFYIDPQASSFDDMEYCVEAGRMSYDELERRYPMARAVVEMSGGADLQIDERPNAFTDQSKMPYANAGNIPGSGTFGNLGSNVVGNFGRPRQNRKTDDKGVVVYEFWLRENDTWEDDYKDVPGDDRPESDLHVSSKWRVIVMANGEILMDEYAEDLWSHGQHPYERYVFDDIGEFYGISLVDHLAYPQIYINRLITMLEHNAELCGNPVLLEPSSANTTRIPIVNRPGQRIPLSGAAAMQNKPEWMVPPPMPAIVMDLVNFWIQRLENTSGLSAITKGSTPNQRNAEGVINTIQEAAFVRVRAALGNLEKTLERSARKIADLIIDNYTQKRIMAIIGPEGEKTAITLFSRHFYAPSDEGNTPLKFIIQIRAGSTTPTSRQARVAEADKLFTQGAIDDLAVLQAHQYPHAQEVLDRLYKKRQQGLVGAPGQRQRSQRT